MKRRSVWIGVGVGVLLLIFYVFDPSKYEVFPKCPFLLLTGLECPGCGSQRAIHSLLHLDVMKALAYNAFLVASLPLIAVLLVAEYYRCSKPHFYASVHRKKYVGAYLILIIVWWVGRNSSMFF